MNSSLLKSLEATKTALWLRATASVLVMTLLWPSYAAAASTLLQKPPFTPIDPPANVMLMLDDSNSMNGHSLPMPSGITLSTSTDPRLCNVAVTGYTTVESCGQVKLLTDTSSRIWVQEGNASPTPLLNGGVHVTVGLYGANLIARAAETVNGQNRILWQNTSGTTANISDDFLYFWNVTGTWTLPPSPPSSVSGNFAVNSADWKQQELDFWYDHNVDSKFGDAPVEWFNRVAISGYGGDEAGNWAVRSFAVSRTDDWILRSPALNPLWYNPAVWYKPWNDNNKTGADAFPNASIGGTANGSVSSRPTNTQLTQRDMRRVPTGTDTYTSVTTLAGTGAIGTWNNYPDPSGAANGRTVTGTLSSTAVRYSYAGMPLEHGATSISNSQTTASDAAPLDLFMRPIRTVSSGGTQWKRRTSCTDATIQTYSENPGNLNCFKRQDCAGNWVYFASDPGTLNCFTRRTSCTNSADQTTDTNPGTLSCFQRLNCAGTGTAITETDPGSLSCWWRRTNCSGGTTIGTLPGDAIPGSLSCPASRVTSCTNSTLINTTETIYCRQNCAGTATDQFTTNPGSLTCYQRRTSCSNSALTTPTEATLSPLYCRWNCEGTSYETRANTDSLSCFQRRTSCTNSTNAGYSTDPGTIFCRNECNGTTVQTTTNPGALGCWTRRTSCTNSAVSTYASDPSAIYCRADCNGSVQQFTTTQASLTCWSRRASCTDSSTQYWTQTTSPGSLSCSIGLELPIVYDPTGPTTSSTTPYLSGGSTNNVTSYSSSTLTRNADTYNQNTVTRSVTTYAPSAAATYDVTLYSRNSSTINYSVSNTPRMSSTETFSVTTETTTGTTTTGPHVERLTPARYYYWNGNTAGCIDAACISARKGNPANYVLVQIDRTRPATGTEHRYVIRDAMTGAEIANSPRNPGGATAQPGQCANGSWCTWEEEAQNFANWYAYYRNRMFSAIAVMAEAMSTMQEAKFQNLRIGYGRINYFAGATNPWNTTSTFTTIADIDGVTNPGALIRGVRPFVVGTTARQQFFDWLFSLAWSGATPNREAVDSAGRYFTRTDNKGPWGETPGTESTLPHIPCRRNFTLLTTDGEWTNVSAGQPIISSTGPLTGSGSPTASDSVDGPTMTSGIDSSTFTYKPANYPQFTGGTSQDRTLTDATVYYWNRDLRPDLANVVKPVTGVGRTNEAFWQSMSTYIVGYGLFASMDTTTTRSAIAAGTSVTWPTVEGVTTDTYNSANGENRVNDSFRAAVASRGQFYTATTVQALSDAVKSTFDELAVETGSSGGVALPGATLTGDNLFYRPSYFLGKHTYGKLEAFKVSDMTTLATNPEGVTPQWNASLPATRTILTSKDAVGSGQAFTAANVTNLSTTQQSQLGGGDSTKAANVVKYLSGDTTLEIANGGAFRNRVSPFGTFVNSKPLYSKAPDFGYAGLETIGSAYTTFVNNNKTNRTAAVYIGGNAGMFHAFKADDGVELFSYVPRGVYENLYALTTPGIDHRYYVDGPVVQGDAYLGSSWKNIIVGTTGAGGASIFALDVTDPANMTSTNVLFDVTKAESDYLGHVLGNGVVGRIKTGEDSYEWVYIVGNGVESISNRAALLVISLEGSNKGVVRPIPVGPLWDNTDANRNGMGGINVVYGPQRSIVAVYAGDKQGNLWRFNFADGKPDNASGFGGSTTDPLFTAKDGTTVQPITTAPVLYPYANDKLFIVFGTGKLYDFNDPTNADVQSLYGILYDPGETTKILSSELNTVSIVDNQFNATHDGQRGWVIMLDAAERVIGNPTIGNSLIRISTYKPLASSNVCLGGGTSRLFSINVVNAQGVVQSIAATSATPSPYFKERNYERPPTLTPTRAQVQGALKGKAAAPTSQCGASILGVDKSVGGGGVGQTTACPNVPVLRVWRPLAR